MKDLVFLASVFICTHACLILALIGFSIGAYVLSHAAIPMKRFDQPLLGILSRTEVQAILSTTDVTIWCGRRDRALLKLLYNAGARVSELIGIRVHNLELDVTPSVRLHGQGRKQRTVPLWKDTAAEMVKTS